MIVSYCFVFRKKVLCIWCFVCVVDSEEIKAAVVVTTIVPSPFSILSFFVVHLPSYFYCLCIDIPVGVSIFVYHWLMWRATGPCRTIPTPICRSLLHTSTLRSRALMWILFLSKSLFLNKSKQYTETKTPYHHWGLRMAKTEGHQKRDIADVELCK